MTAPLRIWWNRNLRGRISPEKLAAHAAHAALATYGITYDHPIVVLSAGKNRVAGMPVSIRDEGRTELEPGTVTTGVENPEVFHRRAQAAAVRAAAEAFPLITRDMVSRGSVRDWFLEYADKLEQGTTE